MIDLSSQNIPFYWASVFFRKLYDIGLREIIISPGSRSTPLTLAAAAHPHLHKHTILDERSAAFTALGIGKATGIPAVLICTSGTALANYYPAVIEARQSGIPLILATADRPPHLRATGANQAIDQLKIFGDYPVFFHEVGEPNANKKDLNRLKILGRQSVVAARQKRGPVHLNFPFRKPLEPQPNFVHKIEKENKARQPTPLNPGCQDEYHLPDTVRDAISSAKRPIIVVGPAAPKDSTTSIAKLAQKIGSPVLSESSIQTAYSISGFAGFLRNEHVRHKLSPDLILRFGFQPTAKGIEQALYSWHPDYHFHFASTTDWQDATFSGSINLPWHGRIIKLDGAELTVKQDWLEKWQKQEERFSHHVEQRVGSISSLTDGHVYHHLLPQCAEGNFVTVSNSFPARDIQLFGSDINRHPLFLNRGVSGIDGITSTAIGISLGLQQDGILFTGDLTFLHDTNALLNQQKVAQDLTIVVINNAGGSIFRMLPIKQHSTYFKDYFETPQSADIKQLVGSYGIPYHLINSLNQIRQFDLANWQKEHSGLSIIECRTDADASMRLRKRCWDFSS